MSDDMYEGGEWRCRVEEQWAREYREIGYEGDCHGYGVNGTDLHGYRHWREWILKCTWETDEWYGEHVK